MNESPSVNRLFRRSRAVGITAAAAASLATVGLIAGVTHTAIIATGSSTSSGSQTTTSGSGTTGHTKSHTNTSSKSKSSVTIPAQVQPAQGGTNGS